MRAMFRLEKYSPVIQAILGPHEACDRLMSLTPAEPLGGSGYDLLARSSAPELFGDLAPSSLEFADCVRSALYLYFSDLDSSHRISQGVHSATGSFLHGIMHRQEPDFSNAKYWFRKVPRHEVFPALREAALAQLSSGEDEAARRLRGAVEARADWDAFWFVDACEAVRGHGDAGLERHLRDIQQAEWRLLFDFCYDRALGGS